jgi:hypothetical protein
VLEKVSTDEKAPMMKRFRVLYKSIADRYVKEKGSEFLDMRNQVTDRLASLFESLLPIVQRIHTRLRSRSG